jgi:hypothetical protein
MQPPCPDLTKGPPRSPRERLAGVVHLPRLLDKARARSGGRLGEYIYPCPLDQKVLGFLELEPEAVAEAAVRLSDDEMGAWVEAHAAPRDEAERAAFSAEFLAAAPADDETLRHFQELVAALGPAGAGVRTWVELLDREEGR